MAPMPLNPENPFARPSTRPLELPDFTAATVENLREALAAGLAEQRREWAAIAADGDIATVENTLLALERSGELLDRVLPVAFTLMESVGGDDFDALEAELMPQLSAHSDALHLDAGIHARLQSLQRGKDLLSLDDETAWLLSEYLRHYRQSGIGLSEADQTILRDLNARISTAETSFSQRATKALENATVYVEDAADLAGLDEETVESLAQAARERGREGFAITFLSPTQQPLLTRLENPATRARLLDQSLTRGDGHDPETDTRALILELARLRAERAALLGY